MATIATGAATSRHISEAEYLAMPETKPYLEFVDGEVIEKCMGDRKHSKIQHEIDGRLFVYRQATRIGSVHTEGRSRYPRATSADYRVPDIAFYAPGRPIDSPSGRGMAPPTIAIEIRSEGEKHADQMAKCRWYRERGVDECWLFDPYTRTVTIFDRDRDGVELPDNGLITSPHMPGFELSLQELFATLDE